LPHLVHVFLVVEECGSHAVTLLVKPRCLVEQDALCPTGSHLRADEENRWIDSCVLLGHDFRDPVWDWMGCNPLDKPIICRYRFGSVLNKLPHTGADALQYPDIYLPGQSVEHFSLIWFDQT